MEVIKALYEAFRGLVAYLTAMLGITLLELPVIFSIIVTFALGFNALFVLRNHIKAYLSEGKDSKPKKELNTREREDMKKKEIEANKPKSITKIFKR